MTSIPGKKTKMNYPRLSMGFYIHCYGTRGHKGEHWCYRYLNNSTMFP